MAEVLLLFRENDIKSVILLEKVVDKNPTEMPHDHNSESRSMLVRRSRFAVDMRRSKKIQQLLQDMSHLKIKIQSMEKDLGPLIFLRKSMSGYVYSELREFDMQLTVARRSEETQIKRNLKKVRSMVSTFSKSVDAPGVLHLKPCTN
ncbi:hypothetical protein LSAT2_006898 [Lamellibrachia satsuma]|nr:hypothetical protein LSAT2_006898 [Lamellibrachia satsuma]